MAQKITRKAAQICMKNMVDQNKFGKTLDKILKQDMGDSPYAVTKKGTPRVEFYGENTIKNVSEKYESDDEEDDITLGLKIYGNIKNWDVTEIKDMSKLFSNCHNFNYELEWDTSNVENMSYMFHNCNNFN